MKRDDELIEMGDEIMSKDFLGSKRSSRVTPVKDPESKPQSRLVSANLQNEKYDATTPSEAGVENSGFQDDKTEL